MKNQLGELVRTSAEETLNKLLDAEADRLANAGKYERTEGRKDTRAGWSESCEKSAAEPEWSEVFRTGNQALMLVGVRLRHITRTSWGTKRYLNMALAPAGTNPIVAASAASGRRGNEGLYIFFAKTSK